MNKLPNHFNIINVIKATPILLGLIVILGWHLNYESLVQINPGWVPMQYNTALCFILAGLASFNLRIAGIACGFIALITLVQYPLEINFGIDELFAKHDIIIKTSHPGRMAILTAFCFVVTSMYYVSNLVKSYTLPIVGILSFLILFEYFVTGNSQEWLGFTAMAIHTAFGFLLIGLGGYLQEKQNKSMQLTDTNKKLKELELELRKSNKSLEEFAYVISHDLKAPLRAINNLVQWITEGIQEKKDISKYSKMLVERTEMMNNLISGLLAYSKVSLESQKVTFCPKEIFKKNDLELQSNGETIYYNEAQFTQIVINLAENARKHHHDPNNMKIKATLKSTEQYIKFCIEDNGPGIDVKHYKKAFEMFQTLKPKTIENSGLGLALVKKIVEANNGKVWIESVLNKGTKIHWTVPHPPEKL